jgi:PAS domain S-box-containing protein
MNDSFPTELIAALDILVAERVGRSSFKPVEPVPEFCNRLFPLAASDEGPRITFDEAPFLVHFLEEAEPFWTGSSSGRLKSGIWVESADLETEYPLQASALCLGQGKFLVVEKLDVDFEERRRLLQSARERILLEQRHNRELKKEMARSAAAEKRLAESEKQYRQLVETANDIIYQTDIEGRFGFVNALAARILGCSEEEAIGRYFLDVVHPDHRDRVLRFYRRQFSERIPETYLELPIISANGETMWIGSKSQLVWEGDRIVGYQSITRDVTERKLAEEKQEELMEELKTFSYIVSHDLRAPLANLTGFAREFRTAISIVRPAAELGLEQMTSDRRSQVVSALETDIPEALRFIGLSVSQMDRLITAILELSRSGRRDLEFERLDMNELVADVLNSLAHQINLAGAVVKVGSLPHTVADRTAMEQIFVNLIDNALKFLDQDRAAEIEVTGNRFPDRNVFVVRDSGRGIEAPDLDRIFQPFQRAGGCDVPGEGMGLSHVRTLVRRHGGIIRCESDPGAGSTFTFTVSNRLAGADTIMQSEKQHG